MLTFSKKYCYKLIRYFKKNKVNIFNSIINRNIYDNKEAEVLISEIENLINSFQLYDLEIKNINTTGLNNQNKDQLIKYKQLLKDIMLIICNKILELPNIIDSGCFVRHDRVIDEFVNNKIDIKNNISFVNYIDRYNIRSSNGRVIFMDNELLNVFNQLANLCIINNCKNGFHFIVGNEFIDKKYLYCAGQLPNLEKYLFKIDENIFCIPTGEVIIIEFIIKNFKKIINDIENKYNGIYKLCTYSRCFRNENSHSSSFNKSLIRQSIFNKVETFIICRLEEEHNAFNLLLKNVCNLLNILNMQYRIVEVCPFNMSYTAYKQYDLEVYFPITKKYIEVASCSSCNTYQLCRDIDNTDKELFDKYCTLNCSALPIERILAAYIEYYWDDLNKKFLRLPMLDSNQQPFG